MKKRLIAIPLATMALLSPISAAFADTKSASVEDNFSERRTVINIEQVTREAVLAHIKNDWPDARTKLLEFEVEGVKEFDYGEVGEPVLISQGPEVLVGQLKYDVRNGSNINEKTVSHNFTHQITNSTSFTKTVTHSHATNAKFTFKTEVGFLGNKTELGAEVGYEYTNSNAEAKTQEQVKSLSFSSNAGVILKPNTQGELISTIFKHRQKFKVKSKSYFDGVVKFKYSVDNGQVYERELKLYQVFNLISASDMVRLLRDYHMEGSSFEDKETGQVIQAVSFIGEAIFETDNGWRTVSELKDVHKYY